jgi:S-adenosylmethionine:tRNA ribosyltransferase-isomerase
VRTNCDTPAATPQLLDRVGATPLPPYILKSRAASAGDDEASLADASLADALDREWYQTVYADPSHAGSVAAPTAGLHFTPELLDRLQRQGVERADVVLHVGAGTFRPIDTDRVEDHAMHAEVYRVDAEQLRRIEDARAADRRVVAVGTTAVRTLESIASPPPASLLQTGAAGETDLFITPGFDFRRVDALITNFHLPRSTLLTLVGALFPEGVPRLLELYRDAIARNYRFYSYGDAMLILP